MREHDLISGGVEIDHAFQAALEIGIVLLDRAFFSRSGDRVAPERDDRATTMSLYRHVSISNPRRA
jgi:hypothetical protein